MIAFPSQRPEKAEEPYEARFGKTLTLIEQGLGEYLSTPDRELPEVQQLWEALRYGTLGGGKRIRAVLILEGCRACGGDLKTALPTACAVELVHAQSLIHDDLPCMDDDELRRGKPSLHKAYDESTAVLAGDALLAMAYGLMSRRTPRKDLPAERLLDLISEFSDVTSMHGLVNGQYIDILYEGRPCTPEILEYIHRSKTGALFLFSARAGAILAGAPDAVVEQFDALGRHWGLAFQIVDDLLDIGSTPEMLGKSVGKDLAQQKATYPALYGEAASTGKVTALMGEAEQILNQLEASGVQTDALRFLTDFIGHRMK